MNLTRTIQNPTPNPRSPRNLQHNPNAHPTRPPNIPRKSQNIPPPRPLQDELGHELLDHPPRHTRRDIRHGIDPAPKGDRDAVQAPPESDFLGCSRGDACGDFVEDLFGEGFNVAYRYGGGGWTLSEEGCGGEGEGPEATVEGASGVELGAFGVVG